MSNVDHWSVDIYLSGEERETYAEARLTTRDNQHLHGYGRARRNPADTDVPEIGEELATARALSDLAHKLLDTAAGDIEEITHQPVALAE